MKILESKKMSIPLVYLVENTKDINEIPIGIPFIRGSKIDYDNYVRLLEYEVLLKSAKASGLSFNWEKILRDNGYGDHFYTATASSYFFLDEDSKDSLDNEDFDLDTISTKTISEYIRDISYQVDIDKLKELKIIPQWLNDIEKAIKENILNTIVYNPNLYNKKLDMVSGGVDLTSPEKNLIIIDISGSIPVSISESILLLAKTMAYQFYADLLITGSKSTLYDYSEIDSLDVKTIYSENGKDNDQVYFKKLLSEYKKYNTAIIFGDNHSPSMSWSNEYNRKTKAISIENGKKLNKWDIKRIYSFHTTCSNTLAGYGDWFDVPEENITKMTNWVTYLN